MIRVSIIPTSIYIYLINDIKHFLFINIAN